MANVLSTDLRNKLERVIIEARDIAEAGAKAALDALGVSHHEAFPHMNQELRALRTHLRARARQIGDQKDSGGNLNPVHLIQECAYEHWHRMLFARFLAENNLLIESESNIAISIDECKELAKDEGIDLWVLASRYAQKMLPQIFRPDDPLLQISLPREYSVKLEALVNELNTATFLASDALGWVYQFWQSKRKKQVNESGKKIGADEISAVTQLFTEPYMVQFLIHNTIGAWWAGKALARNSDIAAKAATEEDLRKAFSLPGVNWEYLRFIKADDGKGLWTPAAGTFTGWPQNASQLKILDPCCGSGHFIVALFFVMVAIRQVEGSLSCKDACDAVLSDNLHGLEIDERCTQIAAFALALSAWSLPGAGGFRKLPEFHIACSGIAPSVKKSEWAALARDYVNSLSLSSQGDLFPEQKNEMWHEPFERGMEALYELFEKAPILGSLIDPTRIQGSFFQADFGQLTGLLQDALLKEKKIIGDETHEMAVAAWGLAKAAELLGRKYHFVITNVPFLGRGKHNENLINYVDINHYAARFDLSTIFIDRITGLVTENGAFSIVSPQSWLFAKSYSKFRHVSLRKFRFNFVVQLGARAFETISGEVVNVNLHVFDNVKPKDSSHIYGLNVSSAINSIAKSADLKSFPITIVTQNSQLANPDYRITIEELASHSLLSNYADGLHGQGTFDKGCFSLNYWEVVNLNETWVFQQTTALNGEGDLGGTQIFRWENGVGLLYELMELKKDEGYSSGKWKAGVCNWGKSGIAISGMGRLCVAHYLRKSYDENVAVIIPKDEKILGPIYCFCKSSTFAAEVKKIDKNLKASCNTLVKVPIDLEYWIDVFKHDYPKPAKLELFV